MGQPLVSVIIPARNERLLADTVESLRAHTRVEMEVILVLDGLTEFTVPPDCKVIVNPQPVGIRRAINQALEAAKGDYVLKVDAHCIFGDDFLETLLQEIEDDWVVVARRYTLDLETMQPVPRAVDYYYLSCPWTNSDHFMMQSCPWITRTEARQDLRIDDLMCFQGSMWLTAYSHLDWFGGFCERMDYAEHHELSMQTWLGGGRVVINKDTWYAHPRKRASGYCMDMEKVYADHDQSARYWVENRYPGRMHDFDWLIDKFWPLPTKETRHRAEKYYWPSDWRTYYDGAL